MDELREILVYLINQPSDINEHLVTLMTYAKECESVLELGVRGCVSSWAFLAGLLYNNRPVKRFIMNDITECPIQPVLDMGKKLNIQIDYKWCNDLELDVQDDSIDLVFIDTWHVYGQLKRELAKFEKAAKKYIIMHDTTVDEFLGETLRSGGNIETAKGQSLESGIPVHEILKGLQPAIDEFLAANPNWVLEKKFTNNNGLTILKRIH